MQTASSANSLPAKYLSELTPEIFSESRSSEVQKLCFQLRFHPANKQLPHPEIAKKIKAKLNGGFTEDSINQTVKVVVQKVKDKFAEPMQADGINLETLTPGKAGRPEASPWEIVYKWLWTQQFPRWGMEKFSQWQKDWLWGALLETAEKNSGWIKFIPADLQAARIAQGGTKRNVTELEKLNTETLYLMAVKLPYPEHSLLLLNRSGEISFMCPSGDFAPSCQITGEDIWIPQATAGYEDLAFPETGREEFLAIVVDKSFDLSLLMGDKQNSAPIWDANLINQLWIQGLERQGNWQAFYQAFEVGLP